MSQEIKDILVQGLTQISEFEQHLILKAWEYESFRQELLSNPRNVYIKETGYELPEGFSIEIIEETSGTIKMVLPKNPKPIEAEAELSEECLSTVTGGAFLFPKGSGGGLGDWWVVYR